MADAAPARVVLATALVVGVVGGVVAASLVSRPSEPAPAAPAAREAPLPALSADCEVDPARPPKAATDLPAPLLDLGALKQGVTVEREVTVRNVGTGALCVLDKPESGCGCVHAAWKGGRRLEPGASGVLSIRVDTTGREGKYDKPVQLRTNDPSLPRGVLEVRVRLEVRLGILVATAPGGGPGLVLFGQRAVGREATAKVRLKSPREEPEWTVLGVESLAPQGHVPTAFRWRLEAVEENDPVFRHYDLVLTHPGRGEQGPSIERLRVRTSHPERAALDLESHLHVVPKYYAGPRRAAFGYLRRATPAVRKTVHVMSGDPGHAFRVTGAAVEGDGFVADAPRETPDGWAVDVRYDGKSRGPGRVAAVLVVSIDDAEMPEVRVELEGHVTGE